MRLLILVSMLLLPLSACMTQRDQTVWQEFKAEMSSCDKAKPSKEEADEAAAEAVSPPVAVNKIQE